MEKRARNTPYGAALRILILSLVSFKGAGSILSGQELPVHSAPIVLRDLTLVRGKTIIDFDHTWIELSDGSRLSWDQVLKAEVAENRQKEFDLNVEQIGLPLFRLKSRIRNRDWVGAGEIAEPIYVGSIDNQSTSQGNASINADTAYLVCLATMNSRIGKSDRTGALMPFVHTIRLQPSISDALRKMVGTRGIPQHDLELGLSRDLLPVWFDDRELENASGSLKATLENWTSGNDPPPGLTVYLASLKIELGQTDQALRLLRSLRSSADQEVDNWRKVLEARLDQKTKTALNSQTVLDRNANKITGWARPVALYYRGINVVTQPETSDLDRSKAILTLLRIPARYESDCPDLAAAAIYQAAKISHERGRETDEQKLRDELLRRYPNTYHGHLETNQRLGR